jgi:hypothetical protein
VVPVLLPPASRAAAAAGHRLLERPLAEEVDVAVLLVLPVPICKDDIARRRCRRR